MVVTTLLLASWVGASPVGVALGERLSIASSPRAAQLLAAAGAGVQAAPAVSGGQECFPACRSGFLCSRGSCVSACNPPCAAGELCTNQGECVRVGPSAPAAPPAAAPSPGLMTREDLNRELDRQNEALRDASGTAPILWVGVPFAALGIVGLFINIFFIALGNWDVGLAIGLTVCTALTLTGAALMTVGFIKTALRAREQEQIRSRIEELQGMLRGAPGHSRGPRLLPQRTVVLARF